MSWSEFESRRKLLFENKKASIYLSIIGLPNVISPEVMRNQHNERKRFLKVQKQVLMLKSDLENLKTNVYFNYKACYDAISEVESEFDRVLFTDRDSDDAKNRRGPKGYPEFLSNWIYETIDMAKGDREKLKILIDFFKPGKEFDKWLSEKSKGALNGPTKNKSRNSGFEADLKWLNDLKKTHKPKA